MGSQITPLSVAKACIKAVAAANSTPKTFFITQCRMPDWSRATNGPSRSNKARELGMNRRRLPSPARRVQAPTAATAADVDPR